MKNKTTAAILAFFLGGFGIHKFYLGESGKGIFYLLFFWTFIPGLIALIDFIILITMDEAKFNSKYNQNIAIAGFGNNMSTAEELEKLHNLKEKGILTEEEFKARKSKLL